LLLVVQQDSPAAGKDEFYVCPGVPPGIVPGWRRNRTELLRIGGLGG